MARGSRGARAFALAVAAALAVLSAGVGAIAWGAEARLVFFWGDGCPHCAAAKPVLERLAREPGVTLEAFEVYRDADNRRLLAAAGRSYGFEPSGVPVILIGDEVFVGYSASLERPLEERVARCLERGCPDPMVRIRAALDAPPGGAPAPVEEARSPSPAPEASGSAAGAPGAAGAVAAPGAVRLPGLGEVRLSGRSHLATTALIALVDGVNPCSLWVLSLLLAVVVNRGSRRGVVMVGVTFLAVSAAVYALVIAGLVNALAWVGMLPWVRVGVAVLALAFALVNLKEYVWYGRGLSLRVPEAGKPRIYRGIRGVLSGGGRPWAVMGATAGLAAGVTVFELPCTVGFPVLWANLVVQWSPGLLGFGALLAVYLLVFLLDELVLFGAALVTLRVTRLEERHGRLLKLLGGAVMLALAATLLLRPEWMNELGSALAVVGGSLAAAAALHLVVVLSGRWATAGRSARSGGRASRAATRRPRARRDP